MTSVVEICNLALSNIRAGSINSLTEGSLQAQQCSLKYELMRNRCLKESIWGFNRRIEVLALLTDDVFNWAYTYQKPQNCLKINRLIPAYEELSNANADVISRLRDDQLLPLKRRQVPYETFNIAGNKVIAANEADLRIDYAIKITDTNLFTDDFILGLSHLLAAEVAISLVGAETGKGLREDELNLYAAYLSSAVTDDLNEQYEESEESEYVTCRR